MGQAMLDNDLPAHQKNEPATKFNEECRLQLFAFQRSFANSMLRRYLGEKKMAPFIWANGLVELFDGALQRCVKLEMLQNTLDKNLHWCAMLANKFVEYEAQPELEVRRELAAKKPSETQKVQRRARRAACREKW